MTTWNVAGGICPVEEKKKKNGGGGGGGKSCFHYSSSRRLCFLKTRTQLACYVLPCLVWLRGVSARGGVVEGDEMEEEGRKRGKEKKEKGGSDSALLLHRRRAFLIFCSNLRCCLLRSSKRRHVATGERFSAVAKETERKSKREKRKGRGRKGGKRVDLMVLASLVRREHSRTCCRGAAVAAGSMEERRGKEKGGEGKAIFACLPLSLYDAFLQYFRTQQSVH